MLNLSKYHRKRKHINNSFKLLIHHSIPDLLFSDNEIAYISNPFDCKWRNDWLSLHNDIHHICDAYACIGADSIQFMAIKPNAIIHIIQITDNIPELISRFERLTHNIQLCSFLNSNVHLYNSSISDFISNPLFINIDFLYCDPPWTDHLNNWFDCSSLISNLYNDIFQYLIIFNYSPKYICFKVPFHWNLFNLILHFLPSYIYHSSGTFHYNSYWIHIITIPSL